MKKAGDIPGLVILAVIAGLFFTPYPSLAQTEEQQPKGEGKNASNPLAKVKAIDFKWQYFDLDGPHRNNFFIDGSFMAHPKVKIKYELHYWETDVTGSSESDLEKIDLIAIFFPKDGKWGPIKYRLAVGIDWILDFGNDEKGIGSGSDQLAPFVALAIPAGRGLNLIPLVQHFVEYTGDDVNQTAFRLIAIQSLPNGMWAKLDAKVPVDWEHDNAIPATGEIQIGKMFTRSFGVFVEGLVGIGADRPYEYGTGIGARFVY